MRISPPFTKIKMSVFNKNGKPVSAKNGEAQTLSQGFNIIGGTTTIKGDVDTTNDIRIDGRVIGKVHSKAKVVAGESSKIEGDVHAQNADISGEIIGSVYIAELVTLKPTARIKGDIHTKQIVVEAGAEFNGACTMNGGAADARPKESRDEAVLRRVQQA